MIFYLGCKCDSIFNAELLGGNLSVQYAGYVPRRFCLPVSLGKDGICECA